MSSSTHSFHHIIILLWTATIVGIVACEEPSSEAPTSRITLQVVESSITHTSVDLVWTKPQVENFKEYQVHFSTRSNFRITTATEYETIDDIEETSTFVSGLRPKVQYFFRIRVVSTDNKAFESNEVSATTASPPAEARIRFLHTASTLPSLILKVDTTLIDTVSFGNFVGYQTYTAGVHFIRLYHNATIVDSGMVTFDTTVKATVLILDKPHLSSRRFSLIYERDMYEPIEDPFHQTRIHFINASLGLDTARLYFGSISPNSKYNTALFGKVDPRGFYDTFVPGTKKLLLTRYPANTMLTDTVFYDFLADRRYSIVAYDKVESVKLGVYIDD